MDDKLKQQLMIGLLFFNVALIGYMVYRFVFVQPVHLGHPVTWGQLMTHLAIGAAIGLMPGIAGYLVGRMMYP
jgi:hypothetical protein